MELTLEQLFLIGIVASVITQGLRLLSEKLNFVPKKWMINVVLLVVSAGLSVVLFGIPELEEDIVSGIIKAGVTVAGSALLIYNVLLEKVLMPPASKLASAIKYNKV
jgi:hypothetical protein